VVFLHGASATAGAFFYQVEALAQKGYSVVSAQYPAYYTVDEWCKGFDHFLDAMKCRAAHLFGAGIGGFLAQHFAERRPQRVRSLMLCNAFATTALFAAKAGSFGAMLHVTPTPVLRRIMLDSFPQGGMALHAKQAIDWVALQVTELSGDDLAARLSLNCVASNAGSNLHLEQARITILESSGETTVAEEVRRDLRQRYPYARLAELKADGDFPYLSQPEEVTLFVEVHLRSVGVFGRGFEVSSPALEETAARLSTPAESQRESTSAGPIWNDMPMFDAPAARPRPERRGKWRNPFKDDPLL